MKLAPFPFRSAVDRRPRSDGQLHNVMIAMNDDFSHPLKFTEEKAAQAAHLAEEQLGVLKRIESHLEVIMWCAFVPTATLAWLAWK